MSATSEDPEESVASDAGKPEQEGPAHRQRSSSYPPPTPGGSVEVRGTVRVSSRPPPASEGDLQLELDSDEDVEAEGAAPEGELEIDVEEPSVPVEPTSVPSDAVSEEAPSAPADEPSPGAASSAMPEPTVEAEAVSVEAHPAEENGAETEERPVDATSSEAEAVPMQEASGDGAESNGTAAQDVDGAVGEAERAVETPDVPDAPDAPDAPMEATAIEELPAEALSEEEAEELPIEAVAQEDGEGSHGGTADAEATAELPAEELEIEEVEEEDPEALELQEMEAEEEPQKAAPAPEPPAPPAQKRKRPWFEAFFNDDYLRTVPPPTEKEVKRQCDFIEREMGLERGATILDVGCGLGMHAVELASRGYLVVGLDLSLAMLTRAGDEAQDRGLKINFLHGDMREMAFEGAFDAVLCWGTTFGYFDDESNRNVIARLYNALKPGGVLLLDVVNRDFVISKQPNLVWFEGDGCVCMEETSFNHITSRLEVKRTVILDDGRQRETKYSLRLYSLHELGQILHLQGFRVAEVSGGEATRGVYLGADSPRLIILAERRVRPSSPPTGEQSRIMTGEHSIPPPPPTPDEGSSNGQGA